MAFSRKMLKAMGIEDEKIDTIIEAHAETVNALKAERDEYKSQAEKVDTSKDWKAEYEAVNKAFESFKKSQGERDTRTAKESALREVYRQAGIAGKYIPKLLKIADYEDIEVNKDGKLKNHDRMVESAKADYAEFVATTVTKGAETATPPDTGKPTMTKAEIAKITDYTEMQKAIAANPQAFGY